jgi:hypothetical protein
MKNLPVTLAVLGIAIIGIGFLIIGAKAAPPTTPAVVKDTVTKPKDTAAPVVKDEPDPVLDSKNWHRAIFNHAEFVVYTGPGQVFFHHWVPPQVQAKPITEKK